LGKVLQNKKKRGEKSREHKNQSTNQTISLFLYPLLFFSFFVTEGFQDLGAPIDPAFNCADIKKRGKCG
jgi:hypothetical protein